VSTCEQPDCCDDFCEQEQPSTAGGGFGDALAPTVMTQDNTG
jgi:hypothetical protein